VLSCSLIFVLSFPLTYSLVSPPPFTVVALKRYPCWRWQIVEMPLPSSRAGNGGGSL
jgi:hypothetical protein